LFITTTSMSVVCPPYCRVEVYADRVACWPLVSYGEHADGTDRRTDGRTPLQEVRMF